jgi:hypothetical protein
MQADPDATCDACGAHGAYHFDGETLCGDCYAGRGSCCSAEFSGRDPERAPTSDATAPGLNCGGENPVYLT